MAAAVPVPVRRASLAFVERKVDGLLLPNTIGNEVYLNEEKGVYQEFDSTTSRDVYSEADKEAAQLLEVMASFQNAAESSHSHKSKLELPAATPKRRQTWVDVQQTMNEAQERYKKNREGEVASGFQTFCNTVGQHGGTFQAWLNLLPDGEYTSLLCGAFKLVIHAAIRAKKIRDQIFNALAIIPAVLDDAKDYLQINMLKDEKLHYAFARLYSAILIAFEDMLSWLSKSSLRHAAGAIFQGADYGKRIEDALAVVKERSINVKDQAARCSQVTIGRIDQNVSRQTVQLNGVTVRLEGVKEDVENLGQGLERLESVQGKTHQNTVHILDSLNAFMIMFQSDAQKTLSANQDHREPTAKTSSTSYLLQLLDFDPGLVKQDITKAVSEGQAFRSEKQERTKFFTGHTRLKAWLTSRNSEVILVNGNHDSDKISSLSFACGILATSLSSFPGAIPLTFFCGMHCDGQTEDAGAGLMLVSLVSQLLAGYQHYSLKFLRTRNFKEKDLRPGSPNRIKALLDLFSELITQIPGDQIVFCVIDGIQFYENYARKDDTTKAISYINNLLLGRDHEHKLKAVVKLLITTPAKSPALWKIEPRIDIWDIPSRVARSDQKLNVKKHLKDKGAEMRELGDAHRRRSHPEEDWGFLDTQSGNESETESEGASSGASDS